MNLGKEYFKEIFGQVVIDREDYSVLEEAIGHTELERDCARPLLETGSKSLQGLVQELPSFYRGFERIDDAYQDFFRAERDFGKCEQDFSRVSNHFRDNPCYSMIFILENGRKDLRRKEKELQRTRKMVGKIERKGKKKLIENLRGVYYGAPGYSEKWFKREISVLKKMLASADEGFVVRALQVGKELLPYHELVFQKELENHLINHLKKEESFENYKRVFKEVGLAKKAGVQVQEVERELVQYFRGQQSKIKSILKQD